MHRGVGRERLVGPGPGRGAAGGRPRPRARRDRRGRTPRVPADVSHARRRRLRGTGAARSGGLLVARRRGAALELHAAPGRALLGRRRDHRGGGRAELAGHGRPGIRRADAPHRVGERDGPAGAHGRAAHADHGARALRPPGPGRDRGRLGRGLAARERGAPPSRHDPVLARDPPRAGDGSRHVRHLRPDSGGRPARLPGRRRRRRDLLGPDGDRLRPGASRFHGHAAAVVAHVRARRGRRHRVGLRGAAHGPDGGARRPGARRRARRGACRRASLLVDGGAVRAARGPAADRPGRGRRRARERGGHRPGGVGAHRLPVGRRRGARDRRAAGGPHGPRLRPTRLAGHGGLRAGHGARPHRGRRARPGGARAGRAPWGRARLRRAGAEGARRRVRVRAPRRGGPGRVRRARSRRGAPRDAARGRATLARAPAGRGRHRDRRRRDAALPPGPAASGSGAAR